MVLGVTKGMDGVLVGEGGIVSICGQAFLSESGEQRMEGGERMSHEDIWMKNNHEVPEVEETQAKAREVWDQRHSCRGELFTHLYVEVGVYPPTCSRKPGDSFSLFPRIPHLVFCVRGYWGGNWGGVKLVICMAQVSASQGFVR